MSRENVEAVRRSHEAFQRGDWEGALAPMSANVVWDDTFFPGGDVYRGHDGVRAATRVWLGTWKRESYTFVVDEYIEVGDKVLSRGWQSGRGKGSGIEVTMDHFQVWTFRDGKAVEIKLFDKEAPALEAVGLRE
jgi:ketosteroid isomerase-like protein